jgi:hypothetical protein
MPEGELVELRVDLPPKPGASDRLVALLRNAAAGTVVVEAMRRRTLPGLGDMTADQRHDATPTPDADDQE